jgi:hypothetical protein
MATDFDAIRTRLKTMLEDVHTTRVAHKYTPKSINAADCPQWIITPAEAVHGYAYNTGYRTDRRWRLILIIAKDGGMPYGDVEKVLDEFFEPVEDKLAAGLQLGELDSQITFAVFESDTGPARINYPPGSDQFWIGCEWPLIVTIKRNVTTGL